MPMKTLGASIILFSFIGCATVFKGYESEVAIYGVPDSVKIYTYADVPVQSWYPHETSFDSSPTGKGVVHRITVDSTHRLVLLRSGVAHLLVFDDGQSVKRTIVYPKISTWWFIADFLCGVLPMAIDIQTGSWQFFEPVYYDWL